jgi:hypothetical protein
MDFFRRVLRWAFAATRVVAAFCLVFCLNGAIQFCFCDTDPDGCGQTCHECPADDDDACNHLTVQIDTPVVAHTLIPLPAISISSPAPLADISFAPQTLPRRPCSTAPPDRGKSTFLLSSARLFPRA